MSKCIVPWCPEKAISSTEACADKGHLMYWHGTMHQENIKAHAFWEIVKTKRAERQHEFHSTSEG